MSQALSPHGAPRSARSRVAHRGHPGSHQDGRNCPWVTEDQCLSAFVESLSSENGELISLHMEKLKQIYNNPSTKVHAIDVFSVVTLIYYLITLC